jgi:hypothetical protein
VNFQIYDATLPARDLKFRTTFLPAGWVKAINVLRIPTVESTIHHQSVSAKNSRPNDRPKKSLLPRSLIKITKKLLVCYLIVDKSHVGNSGSYCVSTTTVSDEVFHWNEVDTFDFDGMVLLLVVSDESIFGSTGISSSFPKSFDPYPIARRSQLQ